MNFIGSEPGHPSVLRRLLGNVLRIDKENERWHQAILNLLRRVPPSESLLDIGCWDGSTTMDYAKIVRCPREKIHGIEINEARVAKARTLFQVHRVDVDQNPIPLPDGSIDVIVCNQVLEHAKNIFFLMGECERVLRPGGHLAFGFPNLAGLMNRIYLMLGRQPPAILFPSPHVRGITHRAFVKFVELNPAFDLVAVSGSTLYPLPYFLMEPAARACPSLAGYTFYLLKKKMSRGKSYWAEVGEGIPNTPFVH